MGPTLNPALSDFWLAAARNRVLYGGRMSSKSWDAAGFVVFLAQQCKIRVLCTRQFQNRIDESVYALLKIQIERFGLQSKFRILDNKIICTSTGSEFMFYGLWRHVGEIKSLESIDIHWAEEAHLMTKEQWDVINPTLRGESSQHWIIFNPRYSTDFVYQRFVVNPPADTIVRKINYNENPFLTDTARKLIEDARNDDDFDHIYGGEPLSNDDASIIKRSNVMLAIDAHIALGVEPTGARRIGFDVADDGDDLNAVVESYGSLVHGADMWKGLENELLKSCSKVWTMARDGKCSIIYDAIGVGATCGSKFNELNTNNRVRVSHAKFFASGAKFKPDAFYGHTGIRNKDFFSNLKAQAWWLVADRFRNTYSAIKDGREFTDDQLIFIDSRTPYLTRLIDELTTPRRDYDENGRVKVESKKDLAKREIKSPNLADAFVMSIGPTIAKPLNISDEVLKRI